MDALTENLDWMEISKAGKLQQTTVGAVFYPQTRRNHLLPFQRDHYDYLIHFEGTQPTELFQQ